MATIQDICDQILKNVKLSNLNFVIAETPFSLEIKIKKKFLRTFSDPAQALKPSSYLNHSRIESSNINQSVKQAMKFPSTMSMNPSSFLYMNPTSSLSMNHNPSRQPMKKPTLPIENKGTMSINPTSSQSITFPSTLPTSTSSNQSTSYSNILPKTQLTCP